MLPLETTHLDLVVTATREATVEALIAFQGQLGVRFLFLTVARRPFRLIRNMRSMLRKQPQLGGLAVNHVRHQTVTKAAQNSRNPNTNSL